MREEIETAEYVASSGIAVRVLPMPSDLYGKVQERALREHPDPAPPKKTIEVVDGTEEVDDLQDPVYVAGCHKALVARSNLLGKAIVDACLEADWEPFLPKMERLAALMGEPLPQDPEDRRVFFLTYYALRSIEDWRTVRDMAVEQMLVTDKEVRDKLRFFRREVARPAGADADARGAAE